MFILRTCARNSATTPSIRASLRRFAASDTASDERIVEMKGSLWTRLMGVFLGVIVVGVIVMVVSIRLSTASQLRRRVLSNDVAQANALAALLGSYYSQNGGGNEVELYLASVPQAQTPPTLQMGPGMMGPASLRDKPPARHAENALSIIVSGKTVGAVLVGSMIEPVLNPADEDFLRSVNVSIFITSLTVGILALVLGSLLFRQITAPLRALSRAAEAIAGGELGRRVEVRSGDEIGRMARSFNQMAESLAQADVQRRNLIADVAHELRTPLTVIQGNLEALMDGVYDLTPENVAAVHKQ